MSPRRFDGWEPVETHSHFDADGVLTGTTVVTREPEWDDDQRALAFAMREYERQTCPSCGGHYSQTLDDRVARDVAHEKFECLDCKAIDKVISDHHRKFQHDKREGSCDCASFATYVNAYLPLPSPG